MEARFKLVIFSKNHDIMKGSSNKFVGFFWLLYYYNNRNWTIIVQRVGKNSLRPRNRTLFSVSHFGQIESESGDY